MRWCEPFRSPEGERKMRAGTADLRHRGDALHFDALPGGKSMGEVDWFRYPFVRDSSCGRRWLQIQSDLGLAKNTVEVYGRGLDEYLRFLRDLEIDPKECKREIIASFIRRLTLKPGATRGKVISIRAKAVLSNATLQQRLTAVRLFYDFLVEEQLCEKNPVARGRYTPGKAFGSMSQRGLVHRARATIASQLYNAREPLSLFELQEWLGHRSPTSTQSYAKISPTKLARSYNAAGYFERNLRTIEVLVDQTAVRNGLANGVPWKYYDLGHGYCTYDFFDQCPHRMACAKCSFYQPKDATAAFLLEGKNNLLRMRQEIPLGESEIAALDDGVSALESLLSRLSNVPSPAGPTPLQLRGDSLVKIQLKGE
jgi:hypothetical protein